MKHDKKDIKKAAMVNATSVVDRDYSEVRGFHARKNSDGISNYLACLKALEIYGVRVDKVADIEEYILGRLPNISKNDKEDIKQMLSEIEDYFKENKNYTRGEFSDKGF